MYQQSNCAEFAGLDEVRSKKGEEGSLPSAFSELGLLLISRLTRKMYFAGKKG